MEEGEEKGARQRKSHRVSIFEKWPKRSDDDSASIKTAASANKRRSSSRASIGKLGKGLGKPVRKKKRTTIEFIRRDSDPLETRINKPFWVSRAWKFLTKGIIEPIGTTPEESHIYTLRSLGLCILHLILAFWVIYGTLDLEYNYHSIIVSDLVTKSWFESSFVLKNIQFEDIRAPQQIWDFVRGVILKILYPVATHNNTHSLLQDNVQIGVARIFQKRVKNDSCTSVSLFRDLYKSCHGYFSEEVEDTEPFGPNSSVPWRYSLNPHNIKSRGYFYDYSGSGYGVDFSKNYRATLKELNELEDNQWIRSGTRAIFLDFALFCPSTNTIIITKITMEIPPSGGVLPSLRLYSVQLFTSFNDVEDFIILGLNIVLLFYTIGLNFNVYSRLKRNGTKTFFAFNNLIDVTIVLSTYATLGVHIALGYYTDQQLEKLALAMMTESNVHLTFGLLIFTYDMFLKLAAVLLLCIVIKLIRYFMYFNETAKLFACSIQKVKGELIWFTIMNVSILFGMGLLFNAIYGSMHAEAMSPFSCLGSLIFSHVRAYIVNPFAVTRTLLFPIDIAVLVCIPMTVFYVNCISLQTYVALMVHGWTLAVRDCAKEAGRIKATELIVTRMCTVLEMLKLYKWSNKLQEYHIIRMNEDDYHPLTDILRRYGWSRLEIRLLLRKYGIRKGDDLSIEELFEVYQDFWMRNTLFFEVEGHEKLYHGLEHSQKMIKYFESTVADLKLSIERLADQFLKKQTERKPLRELNDESASSRKSLLGRIWK